MIPLYAIGLAKTPNLSMYDARVLVQYFLLVVTGQQVPVTKVEINDMNQFERMVTLASSFFNLMEEDLVAKGILHIEETDDPT